MRAALLVAALAVGLAGRASADATVTDCASFGPATTAGTLAFALASGTAGGDAAVNEIAFACSGTLVVPEITIGENTEIDATGQTVTLSGDRINRLFYVIARLDLIALTLTAGNGTGTTPAPSLFSAGGAILVNQGVLVLRRAVLTANDAVKGGAIFVLDSAFALLDASSVVANDATTVAVPLTSGQGGGIVNDRGFVTILNGSSVVGNTASGSQATGGGIANVSGTLILTDSSVSQNEATQNGGGISSSGLVEITRSSVSDNRLTGSDPVVRRGAGIATVGAGDLTLVESTVSGNAGATQGGGISNGQPGTFSNHGPLRVLRSTVSGNTASSIGGGISNDNGALSVRVSTISGNSAGAAGGGVHFSCVSAINCPERDLVETTITANAAPSGGGIFAEDDGTPGLANGLRFASTIVADQTSGMDCAFPAVGGIVSLGTNLDSDGSCDLSPSLDDIVFGSAALGPLADNGGPTRTHALALTSDALDAAKAPCELTDQRGAPRGANAAGAVGSPQPGDCDIGAFELHPFTITVTKNVINDDGGSAGANDFGLSVRGIPLASGGSLALDAFLSDLVIDEVGLAGYAFTGISGAGCPAVLGASIQASAGDVLSCTITNDDVPAQPQIGTIVVAKSTQPPSTQSFDFTLTGPGPLFASFELSNAQSFTSGPLDPGTYAVAETLPPGFAAEAKCSDGSPIDAIDLAAGETVICRVANEAIPPGRIRVRKQTQPAGGSGFGFTLTGGPASVNQGFTLADGQTHDSGALLPGSGYSIAETTRPAGWLLAGATCSNGSPPANVRLEPGEDVLCVFRNAKLPTIELAKRVTNDNGGSFAPGSFRFTIGAQADVVPDTVVTVAPGSVSLDETGPPGYVATVAGDAGCPATLPGQVTVDFGDELRCTVTNHDIPPSLVLEKTDVTNDHGGSAGIADFTLMATGPTSISGPGGASSDATFSAGTYGLSESGPDGYRASEWQCEGGVQDGAQITLALGESARCTIANDDNFGQIVIVKQSEPGDDASYAFTLSGGPSALAESFQLAHAEVFMSGPLLPGTGYVAAEIGDPLLATCDNGSAPGAILLAAEEVVTCTFVNEVAAVPAVGRRGGLVLALLLMVGAGAFLARRRRASPMA